MPTADTAIDDAMTDDPSEPACTFAAATPSAIVAVPTFTPEYVAVGRFTAKYDSVAVPTRTFSFVHTPTVRLVTSAVKSVRKVAVD